MEKNSCGVIEKSSKKIFSRSPLTYERVGKDMDQKFSVFSLFSGAGGLDLGFTLTNQFHVLLGNDIKLRPTQTYARNFDAKFLTNQPKVSDFPAVFKGDVAQLKFEFFENVYPDVIVGGPPCQDFSIVRGPQAERSGISVKRGKLYSHYVRALIHLQPEMFVFENVPGLLSSNKGKAYEVILEDFSALNLRWNEIKTLVNNHSELTPKNYELIFNNIINSSKLGVPQIRRRLIIVGLRSDLFKPQENNETFKLEVFNKLMGKDRLISKYPLTTLEVFEGKPLPDLSKEYAKLMKEYEGVAEEVNTETSLKWKEEIWNKLSFEAIKDYYLTNGIIPESQEEAERAFEEHAELLKELGYYNSKVTELKCPDNSNRLPNDRPHVLERMKRIPPDKNHEFVRKTKWEVEGRGMGLIYRRIHPLKPSYTVVAHGGGGTWGYHYDRKRATLTNREKARLQTFPDSFLFNGNRGEVRAQIGEAVPPLLAKRIAQIIAEILSTTIRQDSVGLRI